MGKLAHCNKGHKDVLYISKKHIQEDKDNIKDNDKFANTMRVLNNIKVILNNEKCIKTFIETLAK